jgi:hypothetical protein
VRLFREAVATDEIRTPGEMTEALMRAMVLAGSLRLRGIYGPARLARRAAKQSIEAGVEAFEELAKVAGPGWVGGVRREHAEFAGRLAERWGEGIELCELVRIVALEAGMQYHREREGQIGVLHEVLARLHARACLLAGEIITLMRAGFASGAHARWRALHETAVIATFIDAGGPALARRFLDYEAVETLAGAREYQANAVALGHEPYTAAEIAAMQERVAKLCERHGPLFRKRYGWAAKHFAYAPNYKEIEAATFLAHYRPYYRMASHPIHAGPKGITFDLGLFGDEQMMLAGPSNAGLADPGHAMCLSLTQVTDVFLNLEPSAPGVVSRRVLIELTERAGDALMTAHRELERDEAELRVDERVG